jgi:ABC-type multidrug transport system ATPase subunit
MSKQPITIVISAAFAFALLSSFPVAVRAQNPTSDSAGAQVAAEEKASILGGVMQATSGAVNMYKLPAREARSFVGYLTQTFSLYQDLSVAENLRYLGKYLEEAEQCNRLGFMVAGELVAEGTPSSVKAERGGHLIELITDQPQEAADLLKRDLESWRVSMFGDRLHVIVEEEVPTGIRNLRDQLKAANIEVVKAYEEPYSLEDVFIAIVEKMRKRN